MTVNAGELSRCVLPNGLELYCVEEAQTATLYREIFVRRCWLDRGIKLAEGGIVVDVGANIGMSTLFFHIECPGVRVLSFEPAPKPFAALRKNVELHRINATCRQVALGARSRQATLTYYPRIAAMSGLHADPDADAEVTRTYLRNCGFDDKDVQEFVPTAHESTTVLCTVARLSDEIRSAGLPRIDLLKIDVEKSEFEVLQGINRKTWPMIRQVALEVHDGTGMLKTVVDRLNEVGYETQVRQDPLLNGTDIYDVAGIRRSGM